MTNIFAVSGTHSAGKTTTINDVKKALQMEGIEAVTSEEVARKCPYPLNTESTFQAQEWILDNHILTEDTMGSTPDKVVIVDRCTLDHFAYATWLYERRKMKRREFEILRQKVEKRGFPYERVFLLDPVNLEPDPTRSMNPEYQESIHRLILNYLQIYLRQNVWRHVSTRDRFQREQIILNEVLLCLKYGKDTRHDLSDSNDK